MALRRGPAGKFSRSRPEVRLTGVAGVNEVADAVLLAVSTVPEGRVTTYGTIAGVVGCGARVVARVLATRGDQVCWWRVVRADGTIAAHLVPAATELLAAEGVSVRDGRVDLRSHGVAAPGG